MEFADFSKLFLDMIREGFIPSLHHHHQHLIVSSSWWEDVANSNNQYVSLRFSSYMTAISEQDREKTGIILNELREVVYPHTQSANLTTTIKEIKIYLFFLNTSVIHWSYIDGELICKEGFERAKFIYNLHLRACNLPIYVIDSLYNRVMWRPINAHNESEIEDMVRRHNNAYVSPLWVAWLNPVYDPQDDPQYFFDWAPEEVIEGIVKLSSKKKICKYFMI